MEIEDDAREKYNPNSQFTFKTMMLKSSLCNFRDAYRPYRETKTVVGAGATKAVGVIYRAILVRKLCHFSRK